MKSYHLLILLWGGIYVFTKDIVETLNIFNFFFVGFIMYMLVKNQIYYIKTKKNDKKTLFYTLIFMISSSLENYLETKKAFTIFNIIMLLFFFFFIKELRKEEVEEINEGELEKGEEK
ncbi:MAG: hypothetical protein PWP46_1744 [Fusobacteriaceae bacterium]|jgi:Cu/Ag efflux pump CusA|nr:hypothetical protein [Fusobacteriales bacterium]MDN5304858.1 hypothetical protein [Fusobacteriaceae bacterium]